MGAIPARYYVVQTVSLFRLVAAVAFASLAFQSVPTWLVASIYLSAVVSDLVDGSLARRFSVESFVGKIIDLISDKSLTIVSLLYVAALGLDLLPLAIIASREVIMLGLRAIEVEGSQLLPTSRIFGGIMAAILWGSTFLLVVLGTDSSWIDPISLSYYFCAILYITNLVWRLIVSRERIMAALSDG